MEYVLDYYIIVNLENLQYLGYQGELTSVMNNTKKFENIKEAEKELTSLDNPKEFAIYQVDVVEEYSFKKVE